MLIARTFLAFVAASWTVATPAQTYPSRPLRIVVPFAAGGGTDIVARVLGLRLTELLGQTVVVDNRAGASGAIGADMVAKSAPDGYTLLLASNGPVAILPSLSARLAYDPVRDFAPVAQAVAMPFLFVAHPSLPVRTIRELVALARAQPGRLNYGSPGSGATTHLATELLKSMAKIDVVHVPYKGVAPASTDLMSGQVQLLAGDLSTLLPHVRSGKMRALAVTSAKRSTLISDVPTVAESGVAGYDASGWFGVLAPAATPRDIVGRLNADILRALQHPDTRERLGALGGEVAGTAPEQFGAFIRDEIAKWGRLIRAIGLKDGAT